MIEERCHNGHLRTPANTYKRPDGRRQCRMCSGKLLDTSTGIDLRGRTSEIFTPHQLADLRQQVRCMECGAVPYDTGEVRSTSNQHGDTIELPVVITEHAEECTIAAQSPRRGRPKAIKCSPDALKPCGECETCGEPMMSAHGRPRKYCSDACRSKAKRLRVRAATS